MLYTFIGVKKFNNIECYAQQVNGVEKFITKQTNK